MDSYLREIKRHIRQAVEFWEAWIAEDEMAADSESRENDGFKVVRGFD